MESGHSAVDCGTARLVFPSSRPVPSRPSPAGAPLTGHIIVASVATVLGLGLAARIARTCLTRTDNGLADKRLFRVVRVHWQQVTGFEIARPGALWGGFCIVAICRDGVTVDLMATRAYSWIPSARHMDELERILWTLEEAATKSAR